MPENHITLLYCDVPLSKMVKQPSSGENFCSKSVCFVPLVFSSQFRQNMEDKVFFMLSLMVVKIFVCQYASQFVIKHRILLSETFVDG